MVLVVLAVVTLAPMLTVVFASPMMGTWGWMMGSSGGTRVSPRWSLGTLLVRLVVLVRGYSLVPRWLSSAGAGGADPAPEELRLAPARGDVSEGEYEERRARLER